MADHQTPNPATPPNPATAPAPATPATPAAPAHARLPAADSALAEARETIRRQRELLRDLLREKYEPVAVVGVGLRFPGANNSLEEFADFLRAGRSAIGPVPGDRWDVAAFRSGTGRGVVRTAGGGFIDGLDQFDPKFFRISPAEANCLDPQQRLVLETAWEALEHAGIDPTALGHNRGGVYVGAGSLDYAMEMDELRYDELDGRIAAGVAHSGLCGRLSYFLGWRGPSVTVDTACSASLVALHMAVEGIRRGECDIALAGGVNAIHHPRSTALFSDLSALAPDGRCKTFDEDADGYGRAEGCGMLVLKRLSDARRDRDPVLALIRGSAVGQDGESAGLTVPNGAAQAELIRRALDSARLGPGDIQYVEAHGTGTPLGDPIEMSAINEIFGDAHSKDRPLLVGSAKTNIGHMEPAAGIGGVIKTIAQLRCGTVFPHLNLAKPSSRIPWEVFPVEVPTECRPWHAETRRALVSSFGFTGTLACVVIEEAPADTAAENTAGGDAAPATAVARDGSGPAGPAATRGHVFTLSAKSPRSLALQIQRYQRLLADRPDLPVDAVCYTGNVGRAHFDHRVAGVVRDRAGLSALLADWLGRSGQVAPRTPGKIAFLFAGQGSQRPGMGAGLYERHPVFRRTVDELDALFAPLLGRSIRDLMFDRSGDGRELHRTRHAQPALFVLEYALARLWLSWGVRPSVVLGHSLGELTAATVAGLFTPADAVKVVAARARLMDSVTASGGMAAVRAEAERVTPLVEKFDDLAVAAYNTPRQCVVSGGSASLEAVAAELRAQGVKVTSLPVSHAFHSPLMRQVTDAFREVFDDVSCRETEFALISNLTGRPARWREISKADYWVRHLVEPVDFAGSMRAVARRGRHTFIEIGPSATLTSLARENVEDAGDQLWLTSLRQGRPDDTVLLSSLASLYTAGHSVSWRGFHADTTLPRVVLPTYAFDRRRYWLRTVNPRHGRPGDGAGDGAGAGAAGEDAPAPVSRDRGTAEGTVRAADPLQPDAARLASPAPDERQEELVRYIRALVADELQFDGLSEVGPDAEFLDLGLDSLGAARVSERLGATLGGRVPVTAVLDHPTARKLAVFADRPPQS
ncbi:beta-ketoacyl synthase N-terminal-like domain-containing protein [Streptomyces sp. NPDC000658]|uniref:type I polyketide synthase n=1 Tax=Streptomyces sp. NPDC000658 TaxID=3154266 RepID=UPI00331DFCED